MSAMRDRIVNVILVAEARLARAEANTARNVAARGGWDAISDKERTNNAWVLAGLQAQVDRWQQELAAWDARHPEDAGGAS